MMSLPGTPQRNQEIRGLLATKNSMARVSAYRALVRNGDRSFFTLHHEPRHLDD